MGPQFDQPPGSWTGAAGPTGSRGAASEDVARHIRAAQEARGVGRSVAIPLFVFGVLALALAVREVLVGGDRSLLLVIGGAFMVTGGVLALRVASVVASARERAGASRPRP